MPKNKNGLTIFSIISIIIVLVTTIFYSKYISFKNTTYLESEKIITLKAGDTFKTVANKIEGVEKFWLNFYLKFNKPNYKLQAGRYKLEAGSDIEKIIVSLKEPIKEEENITLLEGWNIYDMDEKLTNLELINKGDYISYVTNLEKISKLSKFFPFVKDLKTLEGYLYPDTYTISRNNFGINVLVIKQLENFENKVYNKLFITTPPSGTPIGKGKQKYSNQQIEDVINLASIVEKEEKITSEKPIVAGILKKRLNAGWQIGADITVCYPHKLTSQECKLVVSKYINEKSEYNTRTIVGLPKTPIGNPSFETIEATLNDKKTKYWFYLHNSLSGKIYYAETNAQHEANKKYMN